MEDKGILTAISRNYQSGRWQVVLEFPKIPEALHKLIGKEIRGKITRWTEKRSLDANRYFHKLCSLLAGKLGISDKEVKNQLIADYGQIEWMNDKPLEIWMDVDIDWRQVEGIHLQPTADRKVSGGRVYLAYFKMRGSHTYDTQEMSRLIDGTVYECRKQGIETIPPEELERMVGAWQPKAS